MDACPEDPGFLDLSVPGSSWWQVRCHWHSSPPASHGTLRPRSVSLWILEVSTRDCHMYTTTSLFSFHCSDDGDPHANASSGPVQGRPPDALPVAGLRSLVHRPFGIPLSLSCLAPFPSSPYIFSVASYLCFPSGLCSSLSPGWCSWGCLLGALLCSL